MAISSPSYIYAEFRPLHYYYFLYFKKNNKFKWVTHSDSNLREWNELDNTGEKNLQDLKFLWYFSFKM